MVDKNQFGPYIQVPAKSCMTQPWPHLPAVVHLVKTFLGGEKESREKKIEVCPKAVRGNTMKRPFLTIKLVVVELKKKKKDNLYIEAMGR